MNNHILKSFACVTTLLGFFLFIGGHVQSADTITIVPSESVTSSRINIFLWKGDCSSESSFVNSTHPIIPGHYEYELDPNEPQRGLVFAGRLTPDFTTTDPEKFHLHPDIYFDYFLPDNFSVSFDVKIDDLIPSELGPYSEHPWLNVVTLFDETNRAGGKTFHPSVMVNLIGTPGQYRLQAYSIDSAGAGTFYDKIKDGPVFPTGKWVKVRVDVDVHTKQVCVYQDNLLTSTGPYTGKPGLAGAHMGLYTNRKMKQATVFNDDISITASVPKGLVLKGNPSNDSNPTPKQVIVWDGEKASKGAGWTNPTTCTIKPQTVEAHSGNTSLEFRFKGNGAWLGAGWNWLNFKTGNIGTDASAMKNLSLWIKTKGKAGALQINLLCNGAVLDTPDEHTAKVQVLKYCPQLLDGQWHKIVIPLSDLTPAKGFNPKIMSEIHFGFMSEEGTDGSFFIDDIAFDNTTSDE